MEQWHEAALTAVGFFWKALWGFVLGYVISSLIQVLVTQERMQQSMGERGPRSVALGGFFGFISSSHRSWPDPARCTQASHLVVECDG